MALTSKGFWDEASGQEARLPHGLEVDGKEISLTPRDHVLMDDQAGGEWFWLRAFGASSVTV